MDIKGWVDSGITKLYNKAVWDFPDGSTFVEIGVCFGKSTAYMCEQITLAGKLINFHAVDIWTSNEQYLTFQRNMIQCGVSHLIKPHRAPSVLASLQFPAESVDFIFIDADHKYSSAKQDILAWLPKIKRNGLFSGHDIHLKEVRRAVDDTIGLKNVEIWDKCWVYKLRG